MKHTGLLREVGRTVSRQVEIDEKIDALSSSGGWMRRWSSR